MSGAHDPRLEVLVSAARADSPPGGSRERVLASMGISAGASLAGAKAAAAGAAVAKGAGSSILVKSLVVGAVLGAAGMATTTLWQRSEPVRPAPSASAAPPAVMASQPQPVNTPAISVAPEPPAVAQPRASAPLPARAPSAVPSTTPSTPVDAEQLAAERALLDGARQALANSRASTAVKSLTEYEQRFGFGILGHEAIVLKMRSLLGLGRRAEATTLGERYLRDHPHGTQAIMVRKLLGPDPAAAPSSGVSDQNPTNRP